MKYRKALSLLGLIFVVAACAAPEPYRGTEERASTWVMNSVVFVDEELNKETTNRWTKKTQRTARISAGKHVMKATATGTVEVVVVLRNHTDYAQQVEGRTLFFDQAQIPIDPDPVWQRVYLPPKSIATYKEKSVTSDVAFYRVEIKGAK